MSQGSGNTMRHGGDIEIRCLPWVCVFIMGNGVVPNHVLCSSVRIRGTGAAAVLPASHAATKYSNCRWAKIVVTEKLSRSVYRLPGTP